MAEKLEIQYVNLIKVHEGIIHKIISLYVDDPEDKKDLYQEILLQGWRSYQNFKKASLFSTWLYRVSLNTVLNFNKKKKPIVKLDNAFNQIDNSKSENLEDTELLFKIIKSLNEVDRMIMTLHLDGYKNIEIAEMTGINQNHVNVKLHRIKLKVIEQFKAIHNG